MPHFITVKVRMTDTNHAMVKAIADSRKQPVTEFIRDVVDTYCSDQRSAARLAMQAHHYTSRHADDYAEVE